MIIITDALIQFREWTGWLAELGILIYVAKEFHYDKDKDEQKKQKRTKTTKKTTTLPTGDVVTEESTESIEHKA